MSTERAFESDPSGTFGSGSAFNYPISNQVAITDAAVLVVDARSARGAVTLKNIDPTNNVYIGNEDVTAADGFPLEPNEGLTISTPNRVYAICANGLTADLAIIEDSP